MAVTTCLFPFLFLTLELPKRIINDAIGAQTAQVNLFGLTLTQVQFLGVLCLAFLVAVLGHGLLKMRINTMKGVLAERMLRRLRYTLIARMLRFPKPYFQRTSQGELVAMITGETEPMGGIMGDALTQPVLQAGQMLTILVFLFLQSFWFGLAAVALIPLQAWLIPKLQRQINLMNKQRIKEVRQLASIIGESAAGVSDLRTHGGWRHRLALITTRLGIVYKIRFQIYQKKFFMKFINNFITQLTPFFFFSIGGYLVIQGAVSLGALVAALAAYKDLSSPWKELLAFYNQSQDMSLRWETVTEKFSPVGGVEQRLMTDAPTDIPHLDGDIELSDVSVTDAEGNLVLENISMHIPAGALVGIAAPSEEDRAAMADILVREVVPSSGVVLIGGTPLKECHQTTIASRIGYANSKPALFRGSFGENVMMSIRQAPLETGTATPGDDIFEAMLAGNSPDVLDVDWLDPQRAGLSTDHELRQWWLSLIDAFGSSGPLFKKSVDQIVDEKAAGKLQADIERIRHIIWQDVKDAGLDKNVHRFDPEAYNPGLPVASNLLFATLKNPAKQEDLSQDDDLFDLLRSVDLEEDLLALAQDVIELLNKIFGTDGTEHPLFRKLGLEPAVFERAVDIVSGINSPATKDLTDADKAILMTLPAQISAEQIGPAFTDEMQQRIVDQRKAHQAAFKNVLSDTYTPLDPQKISVGLSVLENALFGKISEGAGARGDEVRKIVSDVLEREGLKATVIELVYDLPLSLNGANLPAVFAESLALSRAAIKRPDILVMERVLASYDQDVRVTVHKNLRKMLPDTTLIYISDSFEEPDRFDVYAELSQGRLVSEQTEVKTGSDTAATADLQRKLRALEATDMFSTLNRKQLRLLAFGARWYRADAGDTIFNKNEDPTDGAYMILSGTAGLYNPSAEGEGAQIATVSAGTLVGELGLIRNVPRALTLRAETDIEALRLGAEEFLAVVENDAATSFKLLQVVAGYTS